MKHKNLIYGLIALVVIAGAGMKITHIAMGNSVLLLGFLLGSIFQSWHISQLEKKVKELEEGK